MSYRPTDTGFSSLNGCGWRPDDSLDFDALAGRDAPPSSFPQGSVRCSPTIFCRTASVCGSGCGRRGAEAAVGIADQPPVQRPAVHPKADGHLGDRGGAVEHLANGLIPLLNHRQLLQHGLPLDSAWPKSTGWRGWDTGAGASVAQEAKPGRSVRHRCRSRCGTEVPDFHTANGVIHVLDAVLNVGAEGQ